ncbi:MAG: riboflavin biosynthesis protein RibF [Candidatus Bipolaricaulis sp.]|nr:riboflavin biosynthesis protein RibF [Candidatus Bipolaricaulis sp.]
MKQTAVAIGTFDGVHRGHQRILAETRNLAAARGLESVAYTFDGPPRSFAGPEPVSLLLPPDAKRALLESWVDRVECASFPSVRDLEPAAFVDQVLVEHLASRLVVVGASFRFGRDRSGDATWLGTFAAGRGVDVRVLPPLYVAGAPVSSTRIREFLRAGDVEAAAELLGRPPVLLGVVEAGDRIGRTLGFPTANLRMDPRVLVPGAGIYLAHAFRAGAASHALVYVGTRPTLLASVLRCEVHLLTPPEGDLHGTALEVRLLRRLRDDRRFPDLDALRHQMAEDLDQARMLAVSFPLPPRPPAG